MNSARTSGRRGTNVQLCALLLAAALVYLPSLRNGFVYDDEFTIVRNSLIKSWHRLPHLAQGDYFPLSAEQSYRPLVTLGYFADYALWGLNPFGYHLTNLLLHLAVVCVVFLFLSGLMSRDGPETRLAYVPLAAAALFAVHPVNAEAVNCISFREDILCALWYVSALLLYARGRRYGLSLVCFGLALMSKEMAITLPAIIVVMDLLRVPRKTGIAKRIAGYGGYLAVAAAYAIVAWGVLGEKAPHRSTGIGSGFWAACAMQLRILACDCISFLLPVRLSVEYATPVPGPALSIVLVAVFLLACGGIARGLFSEERRCAAFGGLWFLITLLPVSGLYPIFNPRADRYLYLPSMGLCLAAAYLIAGIPSAAARRGSRRTPALVTAFPAILCVLGTLTAFRSGVWKDNFTLWSDAVGKTPSSARAHTILGNAWQEREEPGAALREYRAALALDPSFVDAHNDLGTLLCAEEKYPEAAEAFRRTIRLHPEHPQAHHNLAIACRAMGRNADAEREFRRALQLNPGLAEACLQLGLLHGAAGEEGTARREIGRALDLTPDLEGDVSDEGERLAARGEYAAATRLLRLAAERKPGSAEIRFNLGVCAEGMGRDGEAAAEYLRAVGLDPAHLRAWDNLGRIRRRQGKWEEAVACHRRALSIDARSAKSRLFQGEAYLDGGRYREAAAAFRDAARMEPDLLEAGNSLGVALGRAGDYAGARRAWEDLLADEPGYAPAERNLRSLRDMGY